MVSSSVPPAAPVLDPRPILDMNYAFARTAMLVAAVRLGIFTHLADRQLTPAELATLAQTLPDPTQRLLDGLRTLGLVEQEGETYKLTPVTNHFLVEGKASYLGGDTLAMLDYLPAWLNLDQTIRTNQPYRDLGRVADAEEFFAPRVRDLFPLVYPIATRMVAALALEKSATALQVLDVGAGSAAWSVAFAQQYPNAQVTAIDLPAVVAEGQQQTAALNLSDRYTWIAADVTTLSLSPATYHLVIVAHLCRFIGEERSRDLLKKLYQSMQPGGTLVIADTLLLDDRSGPPFALTLDLSMLVNTSEGRTFTFQECSLWLHDCGFQDVCRLDVAGPSPLIVAKKGEGSEA